MKLSENIVFVIERIYIMLVYELNDELKSHVAYGMVIVCDYSIDAKGRLTVILEDKAITDDRPKHIKLVFNSFKVTDETFEILGKKVENVYLKGHIKYFKANFFEGAVLVVKHENEKITIKGE